MKPNKERLDQLFEAIPQARVLVVGDIMLDQYLWGEVERISPEAPVPVVEIAEETLNLGGAANVARNVAALAGQVELVGVIGQDEPAGKLKQLLKKRGITDHFLVTDPKRPTTLKTRIMAQKQQVVRADRESRVPLDLYTEERILKYLTGKLSEIDCVLISDYGKGVISRTLLEKLVPLCREQGKFVAVDPKEINFPNYGGVSLITPNLNEASFAAGMKITDDDSLKQVGGKLVEQLKLDSLLVTLGARGMAIFESGDGFQHLPTVARKVYDVTGAGDTVIATLTTFIGAGATLLEAAYLANHAAGAVVGQVGTAVVTANELREILDRED
jgi:D-beta-D-heptose 7-phosphate kinase/D-beta-D-heptose 1-phosphate adenosyltransferase